MKKVLSVPCGNRIQLKVLTERCQDGPGKKPISVELEHPAIYFGSSLL